MLHTAAAAAAAIGGGTLAAATPEPSEKPKAWVITEPNWDNSDEGNYRYGGNYLQNDFFTDKAVADAHCKALNDQFYAEYPTPAKFDVFWEDVFYDGMPEDENGDEIPEEDITWAQVFATEAWSHPFEVIELVQRTVPGVDDHNQPAHV